MLLIMSQHFNYYVKLVTSKTYVKLFFKHTSGLLVENLARGTCIPHLEGIGTQFATNFGNVSNDQEMWAKRCNNDHFILYWFKYPQNMYRLWNTNRVSQKNDTLFWLNILATKYRIFKWFLLLKTENNTQILNIKPFLSNIRGLRYLKKKVVLK